VPAIRAVARGVAAEYPALTHDELLALVDALWAQPVHERRMVTVELLELYDDRLEPADATVLERLVREAGTWALVDGLAASVMGTLVDRHPELGSVSLAGHGPAGPRCLLVASSGHPVRSRRRHLRR